MDVDDLGTILSVWAHPDDETYLAGGLMAAAVARGQRVVCVTATLGERGTDDPVTWPPARLGPIRGFEAAAAMAVLGVAEHHVLGLPDGDLDGHDEQGTALVADLVDAVRPDTILTFGPDGMTGHPDHVAVHRWVGAAWTASGRTARLLHATWTSSQLDRFGLRLEGVFMTDGRPAGVREEDLAVHLRLGGVALDRKVAALRAMATQTTDAVARVGVETFAEQVDEECFVEVAR